MYTEEVRLGIKLYKDVVKDTLYLTSLINDLNLKWKKAKVLTNTKSNTNQNVRNTDIVKVPYYKDNDIKDTGVKGKISKCLSESFYNPLNDYYKTYKVMPEYQYEYSLLRYSIGQKFDEHIDDHASIPRSLSLVYFLNENYTGGEIVFPTLNLEIKPSENTMIIFPSNFIYRHYIKEVTEGIRYSVVTWLV